MCRWLLILVLSVVSTTTWAQAPLDTTTRAWNANLTSQRRVEQLWNQRQTLARRYDDEKREVERLKASRGWRAERELKTKMAEANATAQQLERLDVDLSRARSDHESTRKTLVNAIDAELSTNPTASRKTQLERARATVAPGSRARKIVLPDMRIDELADPEELDEQARLLKQSEAELQNQITGLESQAKELERIAKMQKHSDRTKEMDKLDEGQSRKNPTNAGGRSGDAVLTETGPNPTDGPPTMFEMDASIALDGVVDQPTIDSLRSAGRSGDPKRRADAAKQARDQVAKKLQQLKDRRRQVEDRATRLRNGR